LLGQLRIVGDLAFNGADFTGLPEEGESDEDSGDEGGRIASANVA
jgi:hypothetical protein